MKSRVGTLAAPFPYFGGKSLACEQVWGALGNPPNYVEPFAGSAAMLLGRPETGNIETINDADGFVANFWRAMTKDPDALAEHADWPVNEVDLFARHSWLVRQKDGLLDLLHGDPDYYDAKIAGWWCWGLCSWIGDGWCSGNGPWVHNGETIIDSRQLPHLSGNGQGINRKRPHLIGNGKGINRQLPHLRGSQGEMIRSWFWHLFNRMRNVRVTCGDWLRVLGPTPTFHNGMTGVFLDPPYTKADMDYSAGGVGGPLADATRTWCVENGGNPLLRIVLCGHAGEHDELLSHGWSIRTWAARKGYAITEEARANYASETLWCSPHCIPERKTQESLFDFETESI